MPEIKPVVREDSSLQSPTSSVGPNLSLGSIADGAYGDPPKDNTILQTKEPPPKASTLRERLYSHIALLGRKTKVWFADLFRSPEEAHKPGVKNTWFNEIQSKKDVKDFGSHKLFLGMIPDDVTKRKIPASAKYVSILQPVEANYMDGRIHSDFKAIVHSEDNVGMGPDDIDKGVEALKKAIDSKDTQPIYLHCKSGVGRSATVLAAYLMKYKNISLDEAIKTVQRDRPDAQLIKSNGKDTKHTDALRAYEQARATATATAIAKLLGKGTLSDDETKLLGSLVLQNPKLYSVLHDAVTNLNVQTRSKLIDKLNEQIGILGAQYSGENLKIPHLLSKLSRLFSDRMGPVFAFHDDSLNDLSIGDPKSILDRHRNRKAAFYGSPHQELDKVNGFLSRGLKLPLGSKPFWELGEGLGALERHAGWIEESVPTPDVKQLVKLRRTLALKDGDRVRVGSVDLSLPELTFDEAKQVMKALQKKAQNPELEFGKYESNHLSEDLRVKVQKACEEFLENCQAKLSKMQGELVGFKGTPDNIAKPMRNVDESN